MIDQLLRFIAGFFILLSLILSQVHSVYWLYFTVFVGLNLLQSGITDWCPMMYFLRHLGIKD